MEAVPPAPSAAGSGALDRRPVMAADREDLRERLQERRRAARRHTFWAAMGVSPAALIPVLGTLNELGMGLAVSLSAVVMVVEAWRAQRATREADAIERALRDETP